MSDAYVGQPRFRSARASELLQAQLLQPINITPVQPQLTIDNIGILNSTGPGNLSSNEYDPMYTSNGGHILLNGAYGSRNTKTDNAIISGVYKNLSGSLGQFHYQTDGFRTNDDFKQDIYNAFAQFEVTRDFSLQVEFKSDDSKLGDVVSRINGPNNETERRIIEQDHIRLGGHYRIDPKQDVIASGFYTTRKEIQSEISENGVNPLIAGKEAGYQAELQYLFHPASYEIIAGAGFLDSRVENLLSNTAFLNKRSFYNAYFYTKLHLLPELTTILGLGFDSYHFDRNRSDQNRDQFSPKFGFIWNPTKDLTIRGAAFRTLNRPLAVNQTIEPTQIAGFNQFYDAVNGTTSWQYSAGLDYQYKNSLFFGGETNWRVKANQPVNRNTFGENRNESRHLSYLYWTPMDWLALRAEYKYEKVTREDNRPSNNNPVNIATHEVPLSFNFFHPNGLFAKISGTYVNQNAAFNSDESIENFSESFWTIDTTVGYRLPKRIGLISFEVRNILDNSFNYQSILDASGPQLSPYIPERQIFGKISFFY